MKTGETPTKRNVALDGIRGLAVISVLIYHLMGFTDAGGAVEGTGKLEKVLRLIINEGWAGVDLFFVLSGFLITAILLKSKADPHYFRNFYMRRTLRIFPLYYLYVATFFLVLPHLFPGNAELQALPPRQAWYWTYTSNFEVFLGGKWLTQPQCWSLAIEEQFYWIWPLLTYLLPVKRLLALATTILVGELALRAWILHSGVNPVVVAAFTLARVDGLMMGAILAILLQLQFPLPKLRKLGWALLGAGGLLRGGLLVLPLPYIYKKYDLMITAWVLIFGGFIAISRTSSQTSRLNRALGARGLVTFGKYSYGIYLLHHPIMLAVATQLNLSHGSALLSWLRVGVVGLAIVFPVSWVIFEYFETPFLRLKHRFESKSAEEPVILRSVEPAPVLPV
jgi:peptidoglycan/LPS O-acetylase OafA/YrhL